MAWGLLIALGLSLFIPTENPEPMNQMSDTPTLKEINLTLRDLVRFENHLATLANTPKLPKKTAFRISRLITKLQPEYEEYNKRRAEIIRKHGEQPDPDVDNWNVPDKNRVAFTSELEELQAEPLVLPSWKPLTEEDFGDAEVLPSTLAALSVFLAEED